jgi:hypothetical protein
MEENIKWKQMEKDLSSWLSTFTRNGIYFRNSHQAIIGFSSDGFRSDGMLTDNDVVIAIEVECGQTHPDTNTGKYWLLYKNKPYKKIILFHIYTPDFNSYGWRKELAEFYIEQMKSEVPIEYILLDFRNANDYHQTLMELKKKIEEKVGKEFRSANIG